MSTSQTSKAALRALGQTEWLTTSTLIQKPRVNAELDELFRSTEPPGAGPATVPDWNQLQDGNVELLQRSADKLRHADQAHRKNIAELRKLRNRRRNIVGGFRKRYRGERMSFEGTYGEAALVEVGLDAPPVYTYLAMREQMLEFLERLRAPETAAKLGQPQPGRSAIELEPLADAVGGEIEAYKALMTEIREQRKRADETLIAKRQAIKENRRTIVNVARVQEGLYRLAGLDELADRIRAATPRRRKAKPPETEKAAEASAAERPQSETTAPNTDAETPTATDPAPPAPAQGATPPPAAEKAP